MQIRLGRTPAIETIFAKHADTLQASETHVKRLVVFAS